jgi:hypothetical protein
MKKMKLYLNWLILQILLILILKDNIELFFEKYQKEIEEVSLSNPIDSIANSFKF